MSDWRDKIKQARLPEVTVPIVTRGDLAAEHEAAVDALEKARATKASSLAGSGTGALEERIREIEAESRDSVIEFRLRALPRTKRPGDDRVSWTELTAQHPPREKDGEMVLEDRLAGGVNVLSIAEPLVRVSVVEPSDMTDADFDDLLPALTGRQFDELVKAAWDLNQGRVDIPFWSGGSEMTLTSAGA
jgi:hypothetical protein